MPYFFNFFSFSHTSDEGEGTQITAVDILPTEISPESQQISLSIYTK